MSGKTYRLPSWLFHFLIAGAAFGFGSMLHDILVITGVFW